MLKPITIKNNTVKARLNYCYTGNALSRLDITRYKGKKKLKSRVASLIIDLRFQFQPYCVEHNHTDFNPLENRVVGHEEGSRSVQDFIYEWHFAHRHNFPSDISGFGRGQNARVRDIINHPLSYILLCNVAHENYDKETGEWRNKSYQ